MRCQACLEGGNAPFKSAVRIEDTNAEKTAIREDVFGRCAAPQRGHDLRVQAPMHVVRSSARQLLSCCYGAAMVLVSFKDETPMKSRC